MSSENWSGKEFCYESFETVHHAGSETAILHVSTEGINEGVTGFPDSREL